VEYLLWRFPLEDFFALQWEAVRHSLLQIPEARTCCHDAATRKFPY
jgi:hypothetical protein